MPPIWTRLWSGPARALRPARGGSRSAHSRARPDGPRSSTTVLPTWPEQGRPANPGAWLATAAANRAIDRIRRESTRDTRHTEAIAMTTSRPDPFLEAGAVIEQDGAITDDRLRLIFTCC